MTAGKKKPFLLFSPSLEKRFLPASSTAGRAQGDEDGIGETLSPKLCHLHPNFHLHPSLRFGDGDGR